tara:strand:- start:6204 stop:6620 length:417 start_codon:yes stop_codon:yes gene_type:complete
MIFNIFKVVHILSVISWMAGLLYLPRIFVYHANSKIIDETSNTFKTMERRLYWYICTPAAYASWISGLVLTYYIGLEIWIMLKILFVFGLTIYHFVCGRWLVNFANNNNFHSEKFYRVINEIPTILLIIIIILVVFKF